MSKLRYVFLVLVLTSILVLTACGGGETTTTTITTTTEPTTTATTSEPTTAATTEPEPTTTTPPTTTPPATTTTPPATTTTPPTTPPTTDPTTPPEPEEMVITSTAFEEDGTIPVIYSCDGADISPELNWTGVPEGTQSFALILDDPDAPGGTFTHWVIFNIPADATGLEENVPKTATLASGAIQGRNSFGMIGYGGPCPPLGQSHRYFFTVYALDTALDLASGASKAQLLAAIEGHILAEAEIMGNFQS